MSVIITGWGHVKRVTPLTIEGYGIGVVLWSGGAEGVIKVTHSMLLMLDPLIDRVFLLVLYL